MTRAKEITKEAKKFAKEIDDWEIAEDVQDAFEQGALWADKNPYWISVEDELPQKNGMYIFLQSGIIYTAMYYKSIGLHRDVTHWTHLPQPPVLSNSGNTGKDLKGGEE